MLEIQKKSFRYFKLINHHLNDFKMHCFAHYFLPPLQANLIFVAIISFFGTYYLLLRRLFHITYLTVPHYIHLLLRRLTHILHNMHLLSISLSVFASQDTYCKFVQSSLTGFQLSYLSCCGKRSDQSFSNTAFYSVLFILRNFIFLHNIKKWLNML